MDGMIGGGMMLTDLTKVVNMSNPTRFRRHLLRPHRDLQPLPHHLVIWDLQRVEHPLDLLMLGLLLVEHLLDLKLAP